MRTCIFALLSLICCFMLFTYVAMAAAPEIHPDISQKLGGPAAGDAGEDRGVDAPWITLWYTLDGPITDNGGFNPSSDIDWISQGTNGALTQDELSTLAGLEKTKTTKVDLPNNGGTLGWTIGEIDPAEDNNMSQLVGIDPAAALDNFETYAIIVIGAPAPMTAVMSPAHDDFAHIWLNGEKIYANPNWTGGATLVHYDVEVNLEKGANVLLFRTGESGGGDYFNLMFDDNTNAKVTILPDSTDVARFLNQAVVAVEPAGKLGVVWGELKQ